MNRDGNVVVADCDNHAIRSVTKEGATVSTLADGRQENDDENDEENDAEASQTGFELPLNVVVAANGDIFVSDRYNHAIRVIKNKKSMAEEIERK